MRQQISELDATSESMPNRKGLGRLPEDIVVRTCGKAGPPRTPPGLARYVTYQACWKDTSQIGTHPSADARRSGMHVATKTAARR